MNEFFVSLVNEKPILKDNNGHLRMLDGYKDKSDVYHIFVDYIDNKYNTIHSFIGEIKYFKGNDLANLKDMGIVVKRKEYGVGSPGVCVYNNKMYLFYAGRGELKENEELIGSAKPNETGYVSSELYVNIYDIKDDFSPIINKCKNKHVLKRTDWKSMRIDDPYPIVIDEKLYVYYKGFSDNLNRNTMAIAYGEYINSEIIEKSIILKTDEGYEMPRIFINDNKINMFVRTFNNKKSAFRHYVKERNEFIENDYNFFNGHAKTRANDVCFLKDFNGRLTNDVIACGYEDEKLQQWLYQLHKK